MRGLATIPTLCLADLSEAQVRAYRIADNKLAEGSTWDRNTFKAAGRP